MPTAGGMRHGHGRATELLLCSGMMARPWHGGADPAEGHHPRCQAGRMGRAASPTKGGHSLYRSPSLGSSPPQEVKPSGADNGEGREGRDKDTQLGVPSPPHRLARGVLPLPFPLLPLSQRRAGALCLPS